MQSRTDAPAALFGCEYQTVNLSGFLGIELRDIQAPMTANSSALALAAAGF
jgi:hypothetical protein